MPKRSSTRTKHFEHFTNVVEHPAPGVLRELDYTEAEDKVTYRVRVYVDGRYEPIRIVHIPPKAQREIDAAIAKIAARYRYKNLQQFKKEYSAKHGESPEETQLLRSQNSRYSFSILGE
jgi:hypothetical protein